jgi:HPt (histidine-containing phosphotransfer) domain-containing protein
LEARLERIRLIRRHQPDLIITHRPNDYHPDHRYTSQLVCDASYMVTVPAMAPDTPAMAKDPVIVYMSDEFTRPYPFSPSIVVDIEPVLETVIDMLACHRSQFFDFLPLSFGRADQLPDDPDGQRQFLRDWYIEIFAPLADRYRDLVVATYGEKHGGDIRYVEAFEPCEYGSPLLKEDVERLFPFLPAPIAAHLPYNLTESASAVSMVRGSPENMSQQPNDESELVNWSAALEATDGDEGLLGELVTVFLDEAPASMAQLLGSIEQADAVVLRRSAHTVKGSLRIFECSTASDYAWQLEQIGKIPNDEERDLTAEDLAQAKELWGLLNEQLSRILPAMEERIKKK